MINITKVDLTNLWNRLKLDNKKMALVIAVSLAIIYADYTFLIKLQLQGIRGITPKVIKLKSDIANLAKDLPKIQDLRKNIEAKSQAGTPEFKKIISEGEFPLLLQAISDMANQSKVRVMQINTPKDEKAKEELISGQKLMPLVVRLDLSCTYHSLGSFINLLENAKQFIEVEDMKIARDSRDFFLINAGLALKVYAKK